MMTLKYVFSQYLKIIKSLTLFVFLLYLTNDIRGQEVFRYISSADHVDIKLWTKQFGRSFDSEGIITQNKEYHALTIAGFGILNYEDFIISGDSTSFKHVINQYKYFCDSLKVVYIDNYKGMGLPYKFKFYDLRPPWYSGMTQGVAISFLLRYYKLTNDKEALKKVSQLAWFMLRPEEFGGTIGKTPEGYTFIEEYPNSKSGPQVLNGFINGLIGVREYLNFFPEDTLAQRIHDESYEAMIKTFREYDFSDWTSYNRAKKRISNYYMRYQITELEFLNFIYSDYRLVKQMMLWSYFAHNKFDKETKHYKYPDYQYAVPLQKVQNKITTGNINFEKTLISDTCYSITQKSRKSTDQLKRKKNYLLHLKDSAYSVHIYFDKKADNSRWDLSVSNLQLASIYYQIDSNKLVINSKHKFNQLKLLFNNKEERKLNITSVEVYNRYQFDIPRFGFYKFEQNQNLQADSIYQINYSGEYTNESVVFYRFGHDSESLKNAKYEINNTISLSHPYFIPNKTGIYQFFLSTPMIKGYWISNPTLKLVKN